MEEKLVARARAGDATAFAQLVERYETPVYNLCYRMLGDAAEAERVAQRVFVHAFDQLPNAMPGRSFELRLFGIASQHCIDWLCEPRLSRHSLNGRSQGEDAQPLLASLEPELRCVVVLRYSHGLTYGEMAEVTGDTVSTVKSRLHRARRALAQTLAGQETREYDQT